MLLPQLYVYVDSVAETPKDIAYDYASQFMDATAGECLAANVTISTWNTLKDAYLLLAADVKDYVYNNAYDDDLIATMVERYAVIINKYGYDNFMTNSNSVPVLSIIHVNPPVDVNNTLIGIVILIVLGTSITIAMYIYVSSKRRNRYK